MNPNVEEKKKAVIEHFISAGARSGTTDSLKWMKALLDDLVEAARLSVWEDIKECPECGTETKLSRDCEQCGWFEEAP